MLEIFMMLSAAAVLLVVILAVVTFLTSIRHRTSLINSLVHAGKCLSVVYAPGAIASTCAHIAARLGTPDTVLAKRLHRFDQLTEKAQLASEVIKSRLLIVGALGCLMFFVHPSLFASTALLIMVPCIAAFSSFGAVMLSPVRGALNDLVIFGNVFDVLIRILFIRSTLFIVEALFGLFLAWVFLIPLALVSIFTLIAFEKDAWDTFPDSISEKVSSGLLIGVTCWVLGSFGYTIWGVMGAQREHSASVSAAQAPHSEAKNIVPTLGNGHVR